jgi:hypothetical protein
MYGNVYNCYASNHNISKLYLLTSPFHTYLIHGSILTGFMVKVVIKIINQFDLKKKIKFKVKTITLKAFISTK